MNRYARQQQVPVMGPASAKILAEAHVMIVGVGGLGSPVSLLLAGAGVGEITLIDSDVVSLSNLHRQTLYQESDIGLAKVICAKARLTALNSDIKINAINEALTPDNAEA
jgi:adenylyltransferase/sulfurtransferase